MPTERIAYGPMAIGQRVAGVSIGRTRKGRETYRCAWEGRYLGVEISDGEAYHMFADGTLGNTAQGKFGFPVDSF